MKKTKVILHHIGLGDQLMLNGMVRHLVSKKYRVVIIAKEQNRDSVNFMYRDLQTGLYHHDVIVYSLKPEEESIQSIMELLKHENVRDNGIFLATYKIPDQIWLQMLSDPTYGTMTNWAYGVYMQAGVNPYYMRSKFHVERDLEREEKLFNHYGLTEGEYIFVHDNPGSDLKDGTRKVDVKSDLKIFNPNDTYKEFPNIFDYATIIENAKEVHCMHSCYVWLIDLLNLGRKETNFLHINVAHTYYPTHAIKTTFNEDLWTFID